MVRLKDDDDKYAGRKNKFTFHYGQIKRRQRRPPQVSPPSFTFHYGQIKSVVCRKYATVAKYLHSTMVRLKVSTPTARGTGTFKFTFHYGQIKSNDFVDHVLSNVGIYIPLWSD